MHPLDKPLIAFVAVSEKYSMGINARAERQYCSSSGKAERHMTGAVIRRPSPVELLTKGARLLQYAPTMPGGLLMIHTVSFQ
jgi:hypothetical protein